MTKAKARTVGDGRTTSLILRRDEAGVLHVDMPEPPQTHEVSADFLGNVMGQVHDGLVVFPRWKQDGEVAYSVAPVDGRPNVALLTLED